MAAETPAAFRPPLAPPSLSPAGTVIAMPSMGRHATALYQKATLQQEPQQQQTQHQQEPYKEMLPPTLLQQVQHHRARRLSPVHSATAASTIGGAASAAAAAATAHATNGPCVACDAAQIQLSQLMAQNTVVCAQLLEREAEVNLLQDVQLASLEGAVRLRELEAAIEEMMSAESRFGAGPTGGGVPAQVGSVKSARSWSPGADTVLTTEAVGRRRGGATVATATGSDCDGSCSSAAAQMPSLASVAVAAASASDAREVATSPATDGGLGSAARKSSSSTAADSVEATKKAADGEAVAAAAAAAAAPSRDATAAAAAATVQPDDGVGGFDMRAQVQRVLELLQAHTARQDAARDREVAVLLQRVDAAERRARCERARREAAEAEVSKVKRAYCREVVRNIPLERRNASSTGL